VGSGIADVFVSYAKADRPLALKLIAMLVGFEVLATQPKLLSTEFVSNFSLYPHDINLLFIFFWAGFAPSIWMWLYVLALFVTRGLLRSEKLITWLRWGLDVEKNPFRCCGFDPTKSPMSKPRSLQNAQFAVVPRAARCVRFLLPLSRAATNLLKYP
jgi:hypothetical protein